MKRILEEARKRMASPKWKGKFEHLPQSEKYRVASEFSDLLKARATAAKEAVDLLYNDMLYAADTTDDNSFDEMNRGLAGMTNSLHAIVGETGRLTSLFKKESDRQKKNEKFSNNRGAPWA